MIQKIILVYMICCLGLKLSKLNIVAPEMENKLDRKLKMLQLDNGGEYTSQAFSKYISSKEI